MASKYAIFFFAPNNLLTGGVFSQIREHGAEDIKGIDVGNGVAGGRVSMNMSSAVLR